MNNTVKDMKKKLLNRANVANVVDTLWAVLVIIGLALMLYFGGY